MTRLPRLLVLTDRALAASAGRSLVETVERALAVPVPGEVGVVFREKDLVADERRALGEAVAAVVHGAGAALVVASDPALAAHLGAAAVHLAAADPPVPAQAAVSAFGRSCHDVAEVRAAGTEGAAYAMVSPVFSTSSKPGYGPALGGNGLRALVAAAGDLQLYALGGIDVTRATACLDAGAGGVAVMGAVMTAADPSAVVRDLVSTTAGAGTRP